MHPERGEGPSDPHVIIAGIRQFGLAADGADLRDLEAAIDRLLSIIQRPAKGEVEGLIDRLDELAAHSTPGPWQARFLFRLVKRVAESPGDLLLDYGAEPTFDAKRAWADCEFVVALVSAYPQIAAMLRRLSGGTEPDYHERHQLLEMAEAKGYEAAARALKQKSDEAFRDTPHDKTKTHVAWEKAAELVRSLGTTPLPEGRGSPDDTKSS